MNESFQPSRIAAREPLRRAGCSCDNLGSAWYRRPGEPLQCEDSSVLGPMNRKMYSNILSAGRHLNSQNHRGESRVSSQSKVVFCFQKYFTSRSG